MSAVINVRHSGWRARRGGWARVVNQPHRMRRVYADGLVGAFLQGTSMDRLSTIHDMPLLTVEAVIRWYLDNPRALAEALEEEES